MIRFLGPLGAFVLLILSVLFAVLNDFQKVRVNLGFVTLERVPITALVIVGLIFGMLLMLLVGIDALGDLISIGRSVIGENYFGCLFCDVVEMRHLLLIEKNPQ